MVLNRKHSSLNLRKEVWKYTRENEQFTSLELNAFLGINNDKGTSNRAIVGLLLSELVSWQYLSTVQEGRSYRYYVNL